MKQYIKIRGANEHNLKNIDIDIPRNELVVLTGLSGSGKSSLAFDTIYAEGQRRYMESLSSYARQFLGQMEKPNVESIEGLSPAISIDQKSTNRNPRSTVGTVTEIYDYFRLLYARIGIPHCPKCGREIKKQTVDQMVDQIMELPEGTRIQLLAPVVRGRKGRHEKLLERAKKSGYVRVRVDGNLYELSEEIVLDKNIKHNIEIIVDRLVVRPGIEKRMTDSIENVLELAEGLLTVDVIGGKPLQFSQSFSCPDCNISIEEIEPRTFSFNNPFGACPTCYGLGYKMEFDEAHIIYERLGISAEPKAKGRGHGNLQVRVARHQDLLVLLGELLQAIEEGANLGGDLLQLLAQEELQIDQHLVVARATRVNLLAHIAQAAGQQQLHLRVDILRLGLDAEVARLDLRGDLLQTTNEHLKLLGGQKADRLEHADMGQRALHVVFRQAHIQLLVVAYGVILYQGIRVEALIPKFGCHIRLLNFQ